MRAEDEVHHACPGLQHKAGTCSPAQAHGALERPGLPSGLHMPQGECGLQGSRGTAVLTEATAKWEPQGGSSSLSAL